MKKIFLCIILIIAVLFAGCSNEKVSSEEDGKFLTSAECWRFYDEVTGESEKMSFREALSFYWGCQCGEPIGDSDLYELYDHDKGTQIIKLTRCARSKESKSENFNKMCYPTCSDTKRKEASPC